MSKKILSITVLLSLTSSAAVMASHNSNNYVEDFFPTAPTLSELYESPPRVNIPFAEGVNNIYKDSVVMSQQSLASLASSLDGGVIAYNIFSAESRALYSGIVLGQRDRTTGFTMGNFLDAEKSKFYWIQKGHTLDSMLNDYIQLKVICLESASIVTKENAIAIGRRISNFIDLSENLIKATRIIRDYYDSSNDDGVHRNYEKLTEFNKYSQFLSELNVLNEGLKRLHDSLSVLTSKL